MAHVLLAWELGGNSGHAVRLAQLVSALAAAGHRTSLAVQRPDAFRQWRDAPGFAPIRQAPVWPGLLRHSEILPLRGEMAWGDLLAGMGLTDSGILEYLLRCWDQLLTDAAPDLVIADFAPAAMLAARDRMPVIAVGTGFTVPPDRPERFPLLRRDAAAPLVDETALLQVVNRALWRLGRAPLDRLIAIARATKSCPATFTELDPYAAHRDGPPVPPFLSGPPGQCGQGTGIFAYAPASAPGTGVLAGALALIAGRGQAVSAWMPGLPRADAARLAEAGVRLQTSPLAQAEIAARSRLFISTGGLGATSAALAAGLPMALLPVDLEKRLTAEAVHKLGAGTLLTAGPEAGARGLAEEIITAAHDQTLRQCAQDLAASFRARLGDPAQMVAQLVSLCL
ncbi:glycosyltransferase [Phaeovulum sp. W22_SRMD_FR3]|uniref:glycosyltransferase n=1 Tax=Phaeovulum sp. W22_SRMD_FR3 TaxID=3240274 RepID=UPI003F9D9F7F